jgi:hypothetical protein
MDSTTILRTTSLVGLSSSLFLSGIYFTSTQVALPILYGLPVSTSTKGFNQLYYRGFAVVAPLAVISTLCAGGSAYLDSKNRVGYAIAGTATFGTLAWTRFVMWSCIQRLLTISNDMRLQEKIGAPEVERLLTQWGQMNLVRFGMAAIGGILGLLLAVDCL